MRNEPDRGNAVLLVVAVVALAAGLAMAVVRLATAAVDHQRAQAAADAAALAATTGGRSAAQRLAADNDGELVHYRRIDEVTVEVVVRCGAAQATARATRAP